jgi:hypothetical protein
MKLTHDQIENLKSMLSVTRDQEINCTECLDHVGEFAELQLKGIPVTKALEVVEHHLTLCPECREEYEALLEAMEALKN